MPECVENYSISTANGNVEGTDTLAGAGIWNFLNIYVQQTPVNAPHYSVYNSRFWCRVSSVVHKLFLSKLSVCRPTYTCRCYWYHVLSCPERDRLQNCLDKALAELENLLKTNKHIKLNQTCHK